MIWSDNLCSRILFENTLYNVPYALFVSHKWVSPEGLGWGSHIPSDPYRSPKEGWKQNAQRHHLLVSEVGQVPHHAALPARTDHWMGTWLRSKGGNQRDSTAGEVLALHANLTDDPIWSLKLHQEYS